MKKRFLTLSLCLLAAFSALQAQEKIDKAFQLMRSDSKVVIKSNVQIEMDPFKTQFGVAGKSKSESYLESYLIEIEKPDKKNRYKYAERGWDYIKNIADALKDEASNPNCYRLVTYNAGEGSPRQWTLSTGAQGDQGIIIGKRRIKSYVLLCLADPKRRGYRWCYCIEWYPNYAPATANYYKLYGKIPVNVVAEEGNDPKIENLFAEMLSNDPKIENYFAEMLSNDSSNGNLVVGSTTTGTKLFLRRFNVGVSKILQNEYLDDVTLPVSLYTEVKRAIDSKKLTEGEIELVETQLNRVAKHLSKDSYKTKNAIGLDYVNLALKVVRQSKKK